MKARLTIQLFAKAPVAGTVKTRLIPALSAHDAATLHARMIEDAAAAVRRARVQLDDFDAITEMWCAPDAAHPALRDIASRHGLRLRVQCEGDLGDRMRDALHSAMPGRAILLGSDAPALDADALVAAARALDGADAVLIPAEDGGYVLIACRDRVPDCFARMRWSTPSVMDDTRQRLTASAATWRELPAAWDVDTAADLDRLRADVRFSHLLNGLKTARPLRSVDTSTPDLII